MVPIGLQVSKRCSVHRCLDFLLARSKGIFRGLQESHEEMGVVLESRVEQEMPHACPDGSHKR